MRIKLFGKVREIPEWLPLIILDILIVTPLLVYVVVTFRDTPYFSTLIALVFFLLVLIPFVYFYRRRLLILEKEKNFPQFLKDLADLQHTGLSLVRAVYHTTKQNYGALSPHIKKLAVRLSWGVPFEDAFKMFADETGSEKIKSAVLIILEAFESGGNIPNILETVAEDLRRINALQEERKTRFGPFVSTMYVVFLLSIALSYILLNVLIPEIPVMPSFSLKFSLGGSPTLGKASSIPEYKLKMLFLHLLIVEAIITGLLAGIVAEGSWTAGLKYVLVMSFVAILLFHIFILPVDPVDRIGRTLAKMPPTMTLVVDLGKYHVDKNILKKDIQDFIKNYKLFGFLERNVSFDFEVEATCKPCIKGIVRVTNDGIFISKPVYLNFKVVSNGDGTFTVRVG